MLAQRGEVCVVVEEAGDTGGTGENPVEGDIPEAGQVAGTDDESRRRIHRSGQADAQRPHPARCGAVLFQGFLDRRHDALDDVLPPPRGLGGTSDDGRQASAIIRHRDAQLRPAQVDADQAHSCRGSE